VGVHCSTIWNWERSRAVPEFRHLPKIVAFLGYDPRPVPASLPERLVWYREGNGWSQEKFAKALGVDQSTLARLERRERKPEGRRLAAFVAVIEAAALKRQTMAFSLYV
jgi:transcriptional regulator with XRE-family HTH domain